MPGLLGSILEPNPQNGLLSLALNLAQAGGRGEPTLGGLAGAVQNTQRDTVAARQYQQEQADYQRKQRLQAVQEKAISEITDQDLKTLAQLDPSGDTVAQVMAAKLRAQYGTEDPSSVREWNFYQQMSPEQKEQYLTMKRSNAPLDMGGYYATRGQVSGGITPIASKTLAPGELPSTKGAQAEAAAIGAGTGARSVAIDQKQGDSMDALSTLDEVDKILDKGTATASTIGKGRDAVAGVFGVSTAGAEDAAALDVLSGSLIGKVPRFEGPQSDSDRLLYQKMAGDLANKSLPIGVRKRAAAEVRRIHQKYSVGRQPVQTQKTVARTGKTKDGRKVVEYSDGTREVQ